MLAQAIRFLRSRGWLQDTRATDPRQSEHAALALLSVEPLSGADGEISASMRFHFDHGKPAQKTFRIDVIELP